MRDYLPRGCPKPVWAATTLALGIALTGCGGGGSGGGGGLPVFPVASAPAPAPAPRPDQEPFPGSEPLPSLAAPQPGSTAAAGNGSEGLYYSTTEIVFLGGDGSIATKFPSGILWGSIAVDRLNWSFNADTEYWPYSLPTESVTGSGTFEPQKSMTGNHVRGTSASRPFGPFEYEVSNALAVSQESVLGRWSSLDKNESLSISIDVGAQGAFTGETAGEQIGVCRISGAITQAQPGTAKNMYGFTMNAVDASNSDSEKCLLITDAAYQGPAAIAFSAAGFYDINGYYRNIVFLARNRKGGMFWAALRKQR